jgi:hypothetical protein
MQSELVDVDMVLTLSLQKQVSQLRIKAWKETYARDQRARAILGETGGVRSSSEVIGDDEPDAGSEKRGEAVREEQTETKSSQLVANEMSQVG